MDGQIDYEVLKDMNKDKKWIDKILEKNNIELENVFYAFYTKNKTYIIKIFVSLVYYIMLISITIVIKDI